MSNTRCELVVIYPDGERAPVWSGDHAKELIMKGDGYPTVVIEKMTINMLEDK